MARKSSLKNPPKVPIGRRVSVVMTSDQESDESLVLVQPGIHNLLNLVSKKPQFGFSSLFFILPCWIPGYHEVVYPKHIIQETTREIASVEIP